MLGGGTGIVPVYEHLEPPEVFFGFHEKGKAASTEDGGAYGFDPEKMETDRKLSSLDMAFFFRGGKTRDFSLVRHKLEDMTTGDVEDVPVCDMIRLPVVNKEILKDIFREIFYRRCVDYDDVDLIAEALAQNCIAQFQSKDSDRLVGAFKMSIKREISPDGITDFDFSLSAFKERFLGLEVLRGKCEVWHSTTARGTKHKVTIKPKRLRKPSASYLGSDDMQKEVREVLRDGGSLLIPEVGQRRAVILRELLVCLKYKPEVIARLLPAIDAAVIRLEQDGYAFRGRGVIAYTVAGAPSGKQDKICFVTRPLSDSKRPRGEEVNTLRQVFIAGVKAADPSLRFEVLFRIDAFEADSYYFGEHGVVELSSPRMG